LKRSDGVDRVAQTVDRTGLWRALTPQMFRYATLVRALAAAAERGIGVTDESQAIELLGLQPRLVPGSVDNIKINISGDDLGLLIGWRGETLRALQTALNLMLGADGGEGRRVILDVERYRARREEQVRELALRLAVRVKRSGERYTLDPMHAYERRVIHMTLSDDPGVRTESTGHEPSRRVVIHPTGPAQGGLPDRFADGPRRGPSFGRRY